MALDDSFDFPINIQNARTIDSTMLLLLLLLPLLPLATVVIHRSSKISQMYISITWSCLH